MCHTASVLATIARVCRLEEDEASFGGSSSSPGLLLLPGAQLFRKPHFNSHPADSRDCMLLMIVRLCSPDGGAGRIAGALVRARVSERAKALIFALKLLHYLIGSMLARPVRPFTEYG